MTKLHPALLPFQPGGRWHNAQVPPGLNYVIHELQVALVMAERQREALVAALEEIVVEVGPLEAHTPMPMQNASYIARAALAFVGNEQ